MQVLSRAPLTGRQLFCLTHWKTDVGLEPAMTDWKGCMRINDTLVRGSVVMCSSRLKSPCSQKDFHFLHNKSCYWDRCLLLAGCLEHLDILNGLINTPGWIYLPFPSPFQCIPHHFPPREALLINLSQDLFGLALWADNPWLFLLFSYLFSLSFTWSQNNKAPLWKRAPFGLFSMSYW